MVLLQVKCPLVMQRCGAVPVLGVLIDELDKFNKVAPGMTSEDADDLAWPGLTGKTKEFIIKGPFILHHILCCIIALHHPTQELLQGSCNFSRFNFKHLNHFNRLLIVQV